MRVAETEEFISWKTSLKAKEELQVNSRIQRIIENDHFGDAKILSNGIAELRWRNGMRVYFIKSVDTKGNLVIALLGGNKNSQKSDIKKALNIASKL